jgi:hypothetical protein
MSNPPSALDLPKAHRYFAVQCFNDTWTLIEKPTRSADEDEAMILCSQASLWHWMQRPDCTDQHRSIGHWQLARVYALAGQGENAMRHARRSLAFAEGIPPFFVGYAHESLARAAAVLKDDAAFGAHLKEAWNCAAAVTDAEDRAVLEKDLGELGAK